MISTWWKKKKSCSDVHVRHAYVDLFLGWTFFNIFKYHKDACPFGVIVNQWWIQNRREKNVCCWSIWMVRNHKIFTNAPTHLDWWKFYLKEGLSIALIRARIVKAAKIESWINNFNFFHGDVWYNWLCVILFCFKTFCTNLLLMKDTVQLLFMICWLKKRVCVA